MKTTLSYLVMVSIIILSSTSARGDQPQVSITTTDSLMLYKWVSQLDCSGSYIKEVYYLFDINKRKMVEIYDVNHEDYDPADDSPIQTYETYYYISDSKDSYFRESEVGKSKNGRYIIMREIENRCGVYEILLLTNTRLVLKYWHGDKYSEVSFWVAKPK